MGALASEGSRGKGVEKQLPRVSPEVQWQCRVSSGGVLGIHMGLEPRLAAPSSVGGEAERPDPVQSWRLRLE